MADEPQQDPRVERRETIKAALKEHGVHATDTIAGAVEAALFPDREQVLIIDGEEYDLGTDSLTFGEQRTVRRFVRDLTGDPKLDLGDAALMDVLPALVTVIKQRTDPSFTPDQADAMRLEDVLRDKREPGDPTPPQAASKRAVKSGGSGTPS